MKTKVIIENGKTEIVLTPENDFELDVIEKTVDKKYVVKDISVHADYSYNEYKNHKIVIQIEKV